MPSSWGTVRTLKPATQDLMESRIKAVVTSTVEAFGATAAIAYQRGYPVTFNHAAQTGLHGRCGAWGRPGGAD